MLLSIQSLMSANPYANEPGYENSRHDNDGVLQKKYIEKVKLILAPVLPLISLPG